MIRFKCPGCKKAYQAPDNAAGKPTTCQACGQKMRIPQTATPQTPAAQSPKPQPVKSQPHAARPKPDEQFVDAQVVDAQVVSQQKIPWARWLKECQANFGAAPRKFDPSTAEYLRMEMSWAYGLLFFVPICKLLKSSRQRSIFSKGKVVWAHVIQANDCLWEPPDPTPEDNGDAPGELVFSLDKSGQVNPTFLATVAENLAATRGQTGGDREITRIGDYLEAETVRVFGWDVPQQLSPHVPCFISTTMFLRKHLPDGMLHRPFLPVVVSHKAPYFVMPLPERFWSPELMAWWSSE